MHLLPALDASPPPIAALTRWDRCGFKVSAERRGAGGATRGGDLCTLAVRSPGHIGVVIGDACGRGADGAAQLAKVLPRVRELALSRVSPSRILAELNRTVAAELPMDRFVTAAAFELDLRAGILTVANAAHVPTILRSARGGEVSLVGCASGMPLGILESTTYVEERCELGHGDVLVLMTDGVLEAVESDLVNMTTLKRLVAEASDGATDVHRHLLRRFDECTTGRSADDMTLVAIEATLRTSSGSYLFDFARAG